jgi:thioredoxin 1
VLKVINALIIALFLSGLLLSPIWAAPTPYDQAVKDYSAGRYSTALAEFGTCKTLYPNNSMVHYYVALCEQNLGRFERASGEFRWVLEHGDARLRSLAQTALNQLSRAHPSSSASTTSSPTVADASPPKSRGKCTRVLDFYADWCGPCKAFAPVFDEVKSRIRGVSFERYNVDDPSTSDVRAKCQSFASIPHVILLDANGKELYAGSPGRDVESFERQILWFR